MITLERDLDRVIGVRTSVSAVIFDRQGCLLLQQRSDGGQWGLPGGSVEIGESLREAVAREVREETGLEPGLPDRALSRRQRLALMSTRASSAGCAAAN